MYFRWQDYGLLHRHLNAQTHKTRAKIPFAASFLDFCLCVFLILWLARIGAALL